MLATAVTLQSTTFAAITREPEFSDLSEHWSKSIMMRLNGYGVICGYDDGTIRPDSICECYGISDYDGEITRL